MSDVKKQTPAEQLRDLIVKMEPEFKKTLPPHIPTERFIRILLTALQMNQDLAIATRNSFFAEALKCAQDGLLPDGREAVLQTFKLKDGSTTVKYMPMVAGILKKVRNSGELATISLQVVKEKDEFEYFIDENGEHIKHKPLIKGERGPTTHAYMIAKTKDGSMYFEIMDKAEIDQVREVSRAKNSGPWSQWFDEMAKKTVLRRGSKRLPSSADLDNVIRADDDLFMPEETAPEPKKESKKSSRLSQAMASEPEQAEPTPDEQVPL